jgi:hypothetical protein
VQTQNEQAGRRDVRIQIWKNSISSVIGVAASWKPTCPGAGSVRIGHTWQKRRRKPKASRQKARAEGFDETRGRPGRPQNEILEPRPVWRAFHFFLNLLRRRVRWFKTTNAHRAQPAALRHKRALKALLGKAAETAMDFMRRKRHLRSATIYNLLKRDTSYLNARDTLEFKTGKGFAGPHDARIAIARTRPR